jgi:hypothetical protein
MAMLALSHAILSVSAGTGELSESTLLSEKTTQHLGDILSSRISSKNTNRHEELGVNHGSKSLIYRENIATRSHEVKPGIAREISDKYNIVAMAPPSKRREPDPIHHQNVSNQKDAPTQRY